MEKEEELTRVEKTRILEKELILYNHMMSETLDVFLANEISNYPIFVAHQQELEIGILLSDREKVSGNWTIHLSTLEEFSSKQIISQEKIIDFKATYKSPETYLCVFVLSELGAQFYFLPRIPRPKKMD